MEIIEIARQNDLIIFADEIYDRMVMDGHVHTPVASLAPDVFCVSMNGLSKSHRIAGFRVGWMVLSGPKTHVKGYIEGSICYPICAFALTFWPNKSYKLPWVVTSRSMNCSFLVDEFTSKEISSTMLFKIFQVCLRLNLRLDSISSPKIDRNMYRIDDDEQFVLDFLKQEKVLLVHGRGFNWQEPDHFRIVYLPRVDELAQIQEKMTRFLKQYRR